MKQELIDKYNVSVPRYTSYPPANFFRPFTGEEFLREVDYSNEVREKNLSFLFSYAFLSASVPLLWLQLLPYGKGRACRSLCTSIA